MVETIKSGRSQVVRGRRDAAAGAHPVGTTGWVDPGPTNEIKEDR
jgi:hypothetical protein